MLYHLIHLGCQMNISDAERIRNVLETSGFSETEKEEDADILGIVSCSVRQPAINKVYSMIHKWNKWKNKRSLLTFVTGCILPDDKKKFLKRFDFVFSIEEIEDFPTMISDYGIVTSKNAYSGNIHSFWEINPKYSYDFQAFIPIQNGCDKFCTYCAVPYTRGREVSRSSSKILKEIEKLVHNGYKNITLLGQNVNSYGLDKNGDEITFPELLRAAGELGNKLKKKFWVYFTSPHPWDMTDEVLEVISEYECLADWIHLPLQSGDNEILQKMNRKHSIENYEKIINSIHTLLPQAQIFTDIIVGFSNESEEQFEATRFAFQKYKFNMAYIAMYSQRPGAVSSEWDDTISLDVKKKRFRILTNDMKEISLKLNEPFIGTEQIVLVEGFDRKGEYLMAKTEGRLIVRFKGDKSLIGQFVSIKITSVYPLSMEGDLIKFEVLS